MLPRQVPDENPGGHAAITIMFPLANPCLAPAGARVRERCGLWLPSELHGGESTTLTGAFAGCRLFLPTHADLSHPLPSGCHVSPVGACQLLKAAASPSPCHQIG